MRGSERLVGECSRISGICSGFHHLTWIFETFSYRRPSSVTRIGSEVPIHATASPRGKPRGSCGSWFHLLNHSVFQPCGRIPSAPTNAPHNKTPVGVIRRVPACQKSLAEFAALAANKINSFSAGACTWQKIHLRLPVWNLFASSEQIMHAADCKYLSKNHQRFFDSLTPVGKVRRVLVLFSFRRLPRPGQRREHPSQPRWP